MQLSYCYTSLLAAGLLRAVPAPSGAAAHQADAPARRAHRAAQEQHEQRSERGRPQRAAPAPRADVTVDAFADARSPRSVARAPPRSDPSAVPDASTRAVFPRAPAPLRPDGKAHGTRALRRPGLERPLRHHQGSVQRAPQRHRARIVRRRRGRPPVRRRAPRGRGKRVKNTGFERTPRYPRRSRENLSHKKKAPFFSKLQASDSKLLR